MYLTHQTQKKEKGNMWTKKEYKSEKICSGTGALASRVEKEDVESK